MGEECRRSGLSYLITLTHAPSWEEKFGRQALALRKLGEQEFSKTVRKINRRAKQIGVEPDYDEKLGFFVRRAYRGFP